MTVFTEGRHTAEFLVSEGNGTISRETVTIASGQNLAAGAVLGRVTATGNYVAYDDGAADGSETAVAVLYSAVDATTAASEGVAVVRMAEVDGGALDWGGADAEAGTADLAAANIIVR